MLLLTVSNGELGKINSLQQMDASPASMLAVLLSCAIGIGISWAGWNCRSKTTATTFTIVGVCCKMLSVLVNGVIWDKHGSPHGIAWLILCLAAGAVYRPAPMRNQLPFVKVAGMGSTSDAAIEPEALGVEVADDEEKLHARGGYIRVTPEQSPKKSEREMCIKGLVY